MKKAMLKGKHNRIHKWEWALLCSLVLGLFTTSYLEEEQANLAEGMIRLHVVANSNSEYDQNLKYLVRDAVLGTAEGLYESGISPDQAETLFSEQLELLAASGKLVAEGFEVTAELAELWFPTKNYDHFSLPAGEYTALKITIGEGNGENWWCVAYPPLCLGAASETVDMAVEAGNFSLAEKDLITGNGYLLKFKSMEFLGNLKEFFH